MPDPIAALRVEIAPRVEVAESSSVNGLDRLRAASDSVRLVAALRGADGKEQNVDFTYADATEKEARYENGVEVIGIKSGWRLSRKAANRKLTGTWILAAPLRLVAGQSLVIMLTGDMTPPAQISVSPFAAADPREAASEPILSALKSNQEPQDATIRTQLAETWLLSTSGAPDIFENDKLHALIRETRGGRAWSMVTQAQPPIDVRVLPRGNWQDESGPIVLPSTPSFLPARRESTADHRLTRLDLAQYIVSKENPITARVVTNRLWAMFFGNGLSAKLDDLGSQGEPPSHPELLDWLASEFRESGWDLRHMMRLIVTSATYRQASNLPPELKEIDPANRLLASQNPRRLEAEFVRDNALCIAGALNMRDIGGPSVKPYQPPGYYAALQFPDRDYVASADDAQWRRGIYMHWQRTFLHPMLANFDAPSRDECTAQRTVSNTPQQALTLLNDPEFVEAARLFAARLAREAKTDDARFHRAYQLALAREPKPAEIASLKEFLAKQREYYRANPGDAEKLLRIGFSPPPQGNAAELAAWAQVARVILNSHEVITRY
jgi:hypothetical protein